MVKHISSSTERGRMTARTWSKPTMCVVNAKDAETNAASGLLDANIGGGGIGIGLFTS